MPPTIGFFQMVRLILIKTKTRCFKRYASFRKKQRLSKVLFIYLYNQNPFDFNELGISYFKEYLIQKDYSSFDLYTKDAYMYKHLY